MSVPAPVSSLVKTVSPALKYVTLGTFSWDQDNEKVKVITNQKLFLIQDSVMYPFL